MKILGSPMKILGSPHANLDVSIENLGLQGKNWDLQLECAVTNDKIGASNEEMESPMKIWASPNKTI